MQVNDGTDAEGGITPNQADPGLRRCQLVLAMVHELHKRGYQRLRVMPGMSASGGSWRCTITPVTNILKSHGAVARGYDRGTAHYSSAMEDAYFGWEDARNDAADALADKFIRRFPASSEEGRGRDWAYVGWYLEMLGIAEQGHLPISYADWYSTPSPRWLPTTAGFESGVPMPPPGEARARPTRRRTASA